MLPVQLTKYTRFYTVQSMMFVSVERLSTDASHGLNTVLVKTNGLWCTSTSLDGMPAQNKHEKIVYDTKTFSDLVIFTVIFAAVKNEFSLIGNKGQSRQCKAESLLTCSSYVYRYKSQEPFITQCQFRCENRAKVIRRMPLMQKCCDW